MIKLRDSRELKVRYIISDKRYQLQNDKCKLTQVFEAKMY